MPLLHAQPSSAPFLPSLSSCACSASAPLSSCQQPLHACGHALSVFLMPSPCPMMHVPFYLLSCLCLMLPPFSPLPLARPPPLLLPPSAPASCAHLSKMDLVSAELSLKPTHRTPPVRLTGPAPKPETPERKWQWKAAGVHTLPIYKTKSRSLHWNLQITKGVQRKAVAGNGISTDIHTSGAPTTLLPHSTLQH